MNTINQSYKKTTTPYDATRAGQAHFNERNRTSKIDTTLIQKKTIQTKKGLLAPFSYSSHFASRLSFWRRSFLLPLFRRLLSPYSFGEPHSSVLRAVFFVNFSVFIAVFLCVGLCAYYSKATLISTEQNRVSKKYGQ